MKQLGCHAGGESIEELYQRTFRFLDRVAEEQPGVLPNLPG
jgi:hypothetical protein